VNPPRMESGGKPGRTPARPRERPKPADIEERIDEILEGTFPASDPPAWPDTREPKEPEGG